jgi:prophage maintenance system killer protein
MAPPEPDIIGLTMADLEASHAALAEVFANDPEPIPAWDEGDQDLLETCCGSIETGAFGERKYPDLPSAAAKLFYSGVKLHAFPNGNKRFGLSLLIRFLILNDSHLTCAPGSMAPLAEHISKSDPRDPLETPDLVIAGVATFFDTYLAPGMGRFFEPEPEPDD